MEFDTSRFRGWFDPWGLQWALLRDLCAAYPIPGVVVSDLFMNGAIDVVERIDPHVVFWFSRDLVGSKRSVSIDQFGVIGSASLNVRDARVILTEGVSDFLTMKLLYPDQNVLGFTTLGGSVSATKIVLSLFNDITVCADNDIRSAERNTGITNAYRLKSFYEGFGRRVRIVLPEGTCKDMTEQFVQDLKSQN